MRQKLWMIASGVVLAACGVASGLVTHSSKAVPVATLLSDLGPRVGLKLQSHPSLARDVVILDVKDQPWEVLRSRLATTLNAEWVQEGEFWTLRRTASQARAEFDAETDARLARLTAQVRADLGRLSQEPEFSEDSAKKLASRMQTALVAARNLPDGSGWRNVGAIGNEMPGGRMVAALLGQMDLRPIAAMPPGARFVFALNPTRMQYALPRNALSLAQRFVRENAIMEANSGGIPFLAMTRGMMGQGGAGSEVTDRTPASVLMTVGSLGFGGISMVMVVVTNRAGETLGVANYNLTHEAPPPSFEPVTEGNRVSLTEAAIWARAVSNGARGGATVMMAGGGGRGRTMGTESAPATLTDEQRRVLRDPLTRDPLDLIARELLVAAARAEGKSLVALVPDRAAFGLAGLATSANLTSGSVWGTLRSGMNLDVQVEGSWVTVRPRDAAATRDDRVNRAALARFMLGVGGSSPASLESMAEYALSRPVGAPFGAFDTRLLYMVDPEVGGRFNRAVAESNDMLRLYGALTNVMRQALRQGRPIPVASLSPAGRAELHRMVFWSFDGPGPLAVRAGGGGRGGPMERFGGFLDPSRERTTVLAGGIPTQSEIRMDTDLDPVVLARNSAGAEARLGVSQLALLKLSQSGGVTFGPNMPNFTQFRLAQDTELEFQIFVGPRYGMRRSLTDERPATGPWGNYDSLPIELRRRVEREMEEFSGRQERGPGRPGGGRPGATP